MLRIRKFMHTILNNVSFISYFNDKNLFAFVENIKNTQIPEKPYCGFSGNHICITVYKHLKKVIHQNNTKK